MSIPLNCPFPFSFNSVVNCQPAITSPPQLGNLTGSQFNFFVCSRRLVFFSFANLAISQFAFISSFLNTQTAERSGKKDCARLGGGCMGHIHIVKFSRPISETAKQKKAWSRKSDKVLFSSALQLQAQSIIHWRCRHSTTKWRRSDVWWAGNYLHHDVFINKL